MAGASQASGIGIGAGSGELAVGSFGGSQQTLLSQYLRPPSKRRTLSIVVITWVLTTIGFSLYASMKSNGADFGLIFIAPILLPFLYSAMDNDKTLFHIIVTIPTILAAIWAFVNYDWNSREHPKLMEKYARMWFCTRCGHTWLV